MTHAGHELIIKRYPARITLWCRTCVVGVVEFRDQDIRLNEFLRTVLLYVSET